MKGGLTLAAADDEGVPCVCGRCEPIILMFCLFPHCCRGVKLLWMGLTVERDMDDLVDRIEMAA